MSDKWAKVICEIKSHIHVNPDGSKIRIRRIAPLRGEDQIGPYVWKKGKLVFPEDDPRRLCTAP